MLTKSEIESLMQRPGKTRGVVFDTDRKYVLTNWGPAGLKKVEELSFRYGFPIEYAKLKAIEWYPAPLRILSLLLIKEVFGLKDGQIKEMGEIAPRVSIIVRVFFKLFGSVRKLAKEIPNFWRKHWTQGELEPVRVDPVKKEMTVHLTGADFHPVYCRYLEGYFATVLRITRPKGSVVEVRETRCPFHEEGVPYHEFEFKWTI